MCLLSVQFCLQSLTFLRDADGAAAHPHSQCIHSCINQILGLSCSHDCHRPGETQRRKKKQKKKHSNFHHKQQINEHRIQSKT